MALMRRRCPHGCGADVELEVETVTDGDGVWARSGLAAGVINADDRGHPACEDGCALTAAQTAALETRAADAAALGLDAEQREAAEAAAELAWDAWRNRYGCRRSRSDPRTRRRRGAKSNVVGIKRQQHAGAIAIVSVPVGRIAPERWCLD